MADLLVTPQPDALTGHTVYDLVLTPAGDLALVRGPTLLGQTLLLSLLTGLGTHPTDPAFGSTLPADIGQPQEDASVYALALAQAVATMQARDATNPRAPLDEQIDRVEDVQIMSGPDQGQLRLSFTVYAKSGASSQVVSA